MLVNNNTFQPTILHVAGSNSMVTGDNVDLNKTYKFIYTLDGNNKPFVYETTGSQMLHSFTDWANTIAGNINTTDLREIRIALTTHICPFITRQISKSEYRKASKDYPADIKLFVKKAGKNNGVLETAYEFIEAYMYLKHIGKNINETVLHVVDHKPDKYKASEVLDNWEDSPMAKSGYVKTKEEFIDAWKPGSLVTDWTTEN